MNLNCCKICFLSFFVATGGNNGYMYATPLIDQMLGVHLVTVPRVIQLVEETNNHNRRDGQEISRQTTTIHSCLIILYCREITIYNSQKSFSKRGHCKKVSFVIHGRGPMLTAKYRRMRLQFARQHVIWNLQDWKRVLLADESRFCLHYRDRHVRLLRLPNGRYTRCEVRQMSPFNGGLVSLRRDFLHSSVRTYISFVKVT